MQYGINFQSLKHKTTSVNSIVTLPVALHLIEIIYSEDCWRFFRGYTIGWYNQQVYKLKCEIVSI